MNIPPHRCLDSLLLTPSGIDYFLSVQAEVQRSGYEVTLELLTHTPHTRVRVCGAALLRKVNFLEVLQKLRADVNELKDLVPLRNVSGLVT